MKKHKHTCPICYKKFECDLDCDLYPDMGPDTGCHQICDQCSKDYDDSQGFNESVGVSLDPAWRETKKIKIRINNNKRTYAKCGIGGINKKR